MGYHHGDLRKALIDVSLEWVREHGADALSLRQVAREAGVSSGAPYKHFANKEELLSAVAARAIEEQLEHQREAVAQAGDSPLARFRAQGVSAVVWSAANPELFRLLNRPSVRGPNRSPEMEALMQTSYRAFGEGLGAAMEAGQIDPSSPEVVALAAQALTYGLSRMFVDGHLEEMGVTTTQAEMLAVAVTGVLGAGIVPRS